jgi:hypothetical protein
MSAQLHLLSLEDRATPTSLALPGSVIQDIIAGRVADIPLQLPWQEQWGPQPDNPYPELSKIIRTMFENINIDYQMMYELPMMFGWGPQ